MFLKIFIFFILIPSSICKTYICDSKNATVYLKKGEIAFFETPQFPTLKKWDEYCSLTFMLVNQSDTDHRFYAVIRQFLSGLREWKKYDISNEPKYSLQELYYENAQQGFIIFEDKNDFGCPFESISRSQPFLFTDDTQILHIRSSYYKHFIRKRSCRWQFSAPKGYGFKVVVETFNVSLNTKFLIENDTDKLVSGENLQLHHPYYNSGKWIQIYLSESDPIFMAEKKVEMEFEAYISIVNQNFTETIVDCIVKRDGNDVIWTNFDRRNFGYQKNMRCRYNLIIKPYTEIYVTIEKYILENGVDYVAFYYDTEKFIITNNIDEEKTFVLQPFYNNSLERNVLFEFVSDGSVQSLGFEIRFSQIVCKCADPEITCDENKWNGINKYQHPLYKNSYCGNMNCSFVIKPCHTNYMAFRMDDHLNDYFRIFSNGIVVADFSATNLTCLEIFLNSSNLNTIEVITYSSSFIQSMTFKLKPFNVPLVEREFILSASNPTLLIDTGTVTLATIEISKEMSNQNLSFIAYSNLVANTFWIFYNQSLTFRLTNNKCFLNPPYKCYIPVKKFALYSTDFEVFPFAVFRLSKNYGGCVFGETIFYLDGLSDTYKISDLAVQEKECIITILIAQTSDYFISDIWTSAKNENVSVFIGTDQKKPYFEFNSQTFSSWKDVKLLSKSYIIKIPKKAVLWMELSKETCLTVLQYPSQSVIATPNYGASTVRLDFNSDKFMTYVIGNFTVNFTVLNCKLPKGFQFYFLASNKEIHLNKTGDSINFKNQIISLNYAFSKKQKWRKLDHGLLIYINTVPDTIITDYVEK